MLRCSQRIRAIWLACKRLRADTRGVTAMEYGLIASIMVVAIVTTIQGVSAPIFNFFFKLAGCLAATSCP